MMELDGYKKDKPFYKVLTIEGYIEWFDRYFIKHNPTYCMEVYNDEDDIFKDWNIGDEAIKGIEAEWLKAGKPTLLFLDTEGKAIKMKEEKGV